MQWGIGAHGFVEALYFALFIEKAVLVALGDEEVELEVAPRELHVAGDGCPLAEGDRLVFCCAIGQRVAADDVLLQHVAEREEVWPLSHLFEMPIGCVRLFHRTALRCSPPQKTDRLKVDKKYYFCNTKNRKR